MSACTDTSTPCPVPLKSKGAKARPAPQVLSSAVITPRSRQISASAGRLGNSIVTEPAASSHTSRVRCESLASRSDGFIASYRRCVMPKFASSPVASALFGP
ncbi:hypothetical protein FQZ97_789650 [compost metagenome]